MPAASLLQLMMLSWILWRKSVPAAPRVSSTDPTFSAATRNAILPNAVSGRLYNASLRRCNGGARGTLRPPQIELRAPADEDDAQCSSSSSSPGSNMPCHFPASQFSPVTPRFHCVYLSKFVSSLYPPSAVIFIILHREAHCGSVIVLPFGWASQPARMEIYFIGALLLLRRLSIQSRLSAGEETIMGQDDLTYPPAQILRRDGRIVFVLGQHCVVYARKERMERSWNKFLGTYHQVVISKCTQCASKASQECSVARSRSSSFASLRRAIESFPREFVFSRLLWFFYEWTF